MTYPHDMDQEGVIFLSWHLQRGFFSPISLRSLSFPSFFLVGISRCISSSSSSASVSACWVASAGRGSGRPTGFPRRTIWWRSHIQRCTDADPERKWKGCLVRVWKRDARKGGPFKINEKLHHGTLFLSEHGSKVHDTYLIKLSN